MKKCLLGLLLLGPAIAQAQIACPPPMVKVLRNNQEVSANGAALTPKAILLVSPDPSCTDGTTYLFTGAELTLMRGKRPVLPTKIVHQPKINLSGLKTIIQPGDFIHVFVPYKNLIIVSADGKQRPYPLPLLRSDPQKGINANLVTDVAKGISFNWLLVR